MSLYNMVNGMDRLAGVWLGLLGLTHNDCGRFRDCFLQMRGEDPVIVVYTRNGGGNRDDYAETTDRLQAHPFYIEDYDDDFDRTYASYVFQFPPEFLTDETREKVKEIAAGTVTPEEKWLKAFEALKTPGEKPDGK